MILYGIDEAQSPAEVVRYRHHEIDEARMWLLRGPRRTLVEAPGQPSEMSVLDRALHYGRVLGRSLATSGKARHRARAHPPQLRDGGPASSARQPAPLLVRVVECADEGGCHSTGGSREAI